MNHRIGIGAIAAVLLVACGGSTETAAPATTMAPTTTTAPTTTATYALGVEVSSDLWPRFQAARDSYVLYEDLTFPSCAIGVLGAARVLSFTSEDPDDAELLLLEDCIVAYEEKSAADLWGKKVDEAPTFFYASDVAPQVKELLEEAILAAAEEWGNYGPLEYWVAGLDVEAARALADQFCTRWQDRYEDKQNCLDYEHVALFLPEQAATVSAAVTKGQSQNSAGRNGKRDWGIHLFSSSYPLGFAEVLPGGSFADDQVTAFHEYFHAVQHAHIYTFNNDKRQNEFQVQERANWFGEGGAEWMAQITTQRLRESGVLTPSDANPLAERMAYKMRTMLEWKEENPGLKLSEIPPHGMNNVGYDYGTWAHAYLANLVGPDALLEEFYPNLNQLGHDGAFLHTYNMTMEDFIKEFDSFVSLPIEEQLQILPSETAAPATSTTTVPPTTTTIDPWGTEITTPPEVLYASDVPAHVRVLLEEALTAATIEWGNYGPLEYWVAGIDVPAAEELADQYCLRRISRGQGWFPSKESCLTQNHTAKFLPAQAAEMAVGITQGRAGTSSAGRNGDREWGIHLFSSSYPLCFDDGSRCAYGDDQKTVFHEYFHAVQHSHVFTLDRDERDALLDGPSGGVWFVEGGAEYMAQITTQRLRDSGTLTASTWNPLADRMEWKINRVKERLAADPGLKISEIPYGPDQSIAYDYGTWALAYLADMVGPDALLDSFYANLNDLGWEESFIRTYGMGSVAFIDEFEEFLELPLTEQLAILP